MKIYENLWKNHEKSIEIRKNIYKKMELEWIRWENHL